MQPNTFKQSFLVAGYYTDDIYAKVMKDYLEPSLVALGMDHTIIKLPAQNDWTRGTNLKPSVVKQLLTITKQDFVLIDADARVNVYPKLFDEIPEKFDMAVHYLDRAKWYHFGGSGTELCSGTLFFRNRPICWEIVHKWQEAVKSANVVEQTVLERVVIENKKIKVFPLPVEYCWIHDLPDGSSPRVQPNGPIVVEHFQASRQNRKGR